MTSGCRRMRRSRWCASTHSRLAAITDPEQVVVTVNGQPISVDSGASYSDNVGWQVHSGSYGVVFPSS